MALKALGMISGGLDSLLAAKLIADQGIDVTGVHFITGFGTRKKDYDHARADTGGSASAQAMRSAEALGISLHAIDISDEYFPIVQNPCHGYGANMNPCIDCKIFMFKTMGNLMRTMNAKFIFTGEVLGQRPMTQHRRTLKMIETKSGLTGLVLRPLSARLLDPTVPETKGWVDRVKLGAISGRSRSPQVTLAKELGFTDYPQPAGGCCHLINPDYSSRLRDFLRYRGTMTLDREMALLLGIGRHFRLSPRVKVIVGRDEKENTLLENFRNGRHLFRVVEYPAADVLADIEGEPTPEDFERIASIAVHYSDAPKETGVQVEHFYGTIRQEWIAKNVMASHLNLWRI